MNLDNNHTEGTFLPKKIFENHLSTLSTLHHCQCFQWLVLYPGLSWGGGEGSGIQGGSTVYFSNLQFSCRTSSTVHFLLLSFPVWRAPGRHITCLGQQPPSLAYDDYNNFLDFTPMQCNLEYFIIRAYLGAILFFSITKFKET